MGRIVTPKYRVETKDNAGCKSPMVWRGRASAERLAAWVKGMNDSFKPGGINFHVSKARDILVYIYQAKIIEQKTGKVVAEFNAPAFEII